MSPALIAVLPFLGALLPGLMVRSGRSPAAIACAAITAVALLGLLLHIPTVLAGEVVTTRLPWMPQIGLNADFMLDGLGLLFGILILGIGLLIILYACFYLSEKDAAGPFFTYLMLFQGAMTGIVLTDNILMLLVFWELTSLSSFLLIGFWKHLPEGRQGARMALTVTALGGLAMIAGCLMLGQVAGSYRLSEIIAQREAIQGSDLYLPALLLILLGAFTKSAQFPFHFWLPRAMAAPTPVSAYLHSATMVKAGIFLMARLWPVLSGTPEWFGIVATAGLVTMLVGAVIALFQDDLKGLLAYSTVSHLGLITMLLGFGTEAAATAAMFHITAHASFKAALFMGAGIIDHGTHTRSIRQLGGLRSLMPLTFGLILVASLSMAGIPPFNGFLSKEMMLEQAAAQAGHGMGWAIGALATLAALASVAYSLRLVAHVFLGPARDDYPHAPHDQAPASGQDRRCWWGWSWSRGCSRTRRWAGWSPPRAAPSRRPRSTPISRCGTASPRRWRCRCWPSGAASCCCGAGTGRTGCATACPGPTPSGSSTRSSAPSPASRAASPTASPTGPCRGRWRC